MDSTGLDVSAEPANPKAKKWARAIVLLMIIAFLIAPAKELIPFQGDQPIYVRCCACPLPIN